MLLTKAHREIWSLAIDRQHLFRIREKNIDFDLHPITDDEKQFVMLLLLHITTSFELSKSNSIINIEKTKQDVDGFLDYPIPSRIWVETKSFFNSDFIAFVDRKGENKPISL